MAPRKNRFRLGGIAAIAAAALVFTGCAAGEESSNDDARSANFVYAVAGVPDHLDQTPWGGQPSKILYAALDSTLVRYQGSCDVLGESKDLTPNLAESWERADDGTSVIFHLSDAVSSYGNELTADDVKWSVERQMEHEPFIPTALGFIGSYNVDDLVTIIDDKTVQMNALEAKSFDVMQFASVLLTVHDSTEAKKNATTDDPWATGFLSKNVANFGPWELDRFTPGEEVVFNANPNYKGERGNFETLTIRAVPESSTRAQLVSAGDVQWADDLTFPEYRQLQSAEGVTVESCVSADRDDLFLQQDGAVFADPNIRKAISMAIDRESLIESVYFGFADPAEHGVPQYYEFDTPAETYTYDPEAAQDLLAEAGYPDGLEFTALYSDSRPGPHVEQLAVQIQSDLKKIGVTMDLDNVSGSADFFVTVNKGRYDAVFYSDSTYVGDATYGAAAFTHSKSGINSFGYASAEYDGLVAAAQAASPDDRSRLIAEIASLGTTDMPIVYLTDRRNVQAHGANVTGFTNNPMRTIYPALLSAG